jgi:hypothetical protein
MAYYRGKKKSDIQNKERNLKSARQKCISYIKTNPSEKQISKQKV